MYSEELLVACQSPLSLITAVLFELLSLELEPGAITTVPSQPTSIMCMGEASLVLRIQTTLYFLLYKGLVRELCSLSIT